MKAEARRIESFHLNVKTTVNTIMKTMQEEWRNYRDKCYPQGIPATQNKETHQAFFAGALSMGALMEALSALPEDAAVKELEKLTKEVLQVCQFRADTLKARN